MSESNEGAMGEGRRVREGVVGGGGNGGASPRKILKFRMQESASETIFQ